MKTGCLMAGWSMQHGSTLSTSYLLNVLAFRSKNCKYVEKHFFKSKRVQSKSDWNQMERPFYVSILHQHQQQWNCVEPKPASPSLVELEWISLTLVGLYLYGNDLTALCFGAIHLTALSLSLTTWCWWRTDKDSQQAVRLYSLREHINLTTTHWESTETSPPLTVVTVQYQPM